MKTKNIFLAIILSLLVTFGTSTLNAQQPTVVNSNIYGDIAYSYLQDIDANHQQRRAGGENELAMANYIKNELSNFGYIPSVQQFNYTRSSTEYTSQNIIASKPGKSDKQIIVGAHYDSVGTNGAGDNGSGVAVTLEMAQKLINMDTNYTIVFIFFGAEEVGLKGSQAYTNAMSQEEIDKTILMINLDSILAGTYPYIYGGVVSNDKVIDTWGVEQGMELSKELNLGLRLNNTTLNYDYPTPSTGNWSDHASFHKKGITYLYLEASNWEVLDDENNPAEGSSGAAETEIGPVMHDASRDNLAFIENQFGNRGKENIKTFSTFLYNYLLRVDPTGLKKDNEKLPLYKTTIKNNTTYYYKLVNGKYLNYKKVIVDKNTVTTYEYTLSTKKLKKGISIIKTKNKKIVEKIYYKYNKKGLLNNKKIYKLNKKNKFIKQYHKTITYHTNNKIKIKSIIKKNLTNKKTYAVKAKYNKNEVKTKLIKYAYNKKGNKTHRFEYKYVNGKLKSTKKNKAIKYITYYKKNKAYKTIKKYYNKKGKLLKKTCKSNLKVGFN